MADQFATSFGVLEYSGMLFNKGNTQCPFSTAIGGRSKTTNHVEFVVGQEYNTDTELKQPEISETASLTAPDATVVTRKQTTNVTQIFMDAVGISYAKESNMGTLSGINIANQSGNPINELDFQVAAHMQQIRNQIEYTFINGVYAKATSDTTANKTRGMVAAITSNEIKMAGKELTVWDVADMLKQIQDGHAPTSGLTLWVDGITRLQLNASAIQNDMTIVPSDRTINGINISTLVTPMGSIDLVSAQYFPKGTALVLNTGIIAPVYQPVPGKGNFFLEELARTGAGRKFQLFGQLGLDYGAEWYHGKFTGLAETYTRPSNSATAEQVAVAAAEQTESKK